ncbi:MAG TPA: TolC family protein [Polyangiaceae bacterium]|nr:TolC family protein [Polyangiaceae bacterium]
MKAFPDVRTFRTPSTARSFIATVLLLHIGGVAQAQSLTEADVIRLTRAHDPSVLTAHAAASLAASEEIRAGLHPNPSLSWAREDSLGDAAGRERQDSVYVTLPIEVTGRRPAQKAIARSNAALAKARAVRAQRQAVITALRAFYEVLASEQQREIAQRAVARLDEATRVVGRRQQEGTSSGYERVRLEVEAELARTQLQEAEAATRMARAVFAALLGLDAAEVELRGDFRTLTVDESGRSRVSDALEPLRSAKAHAQDAHSSAGAAWIPALSVTGGLLVTDATSTRHGYLAGISVELPIFSRGQELRAEAAAQQQLVAAESRLAERELKLDELRATEQLRSARQEIDRFGKATAERVAVLERAVQSGYQEGRWTVVDLVDAQAARSAVDRRKLELDLAAKQAEIALRAVRGEFE